MSWPTIFANLAGGNQPLSLFDTMFNQVASMIAIPTTFTGQNAIVATPIGNAPILAAYGNFNIFRGIAVATSNAPVTFQFSTLAALPVYKADGATQVGANDVLTGQEYVFVFSQALNAGAGGFYLENAVVTVTGAAAGGTFANLRIANNGANPDTRVDVSADELVMVNATGQSVRALNQSFTINFATIGAVNGLDVGGQSAGGDYFLWAISNGSTTGGLASRSSTNPTLPAGYTFKKRIGAVKPDTTTGASSTVTISNASPGVVSWAAHGQAIGTPFTLSTTGTLPAPLVPGTVYYFLPQGFGANSFQLSQTQNGVAINTTSAGSGVHTATVPGIRLRRTLQVGNKTQYVVGTATPTPSLPNLDGGASKGTYSPTTPTWVAVPVAFALPATAVQIDIVLQLNLGNQGINAIQLAPNNAYGGREAIGVAGPWYDTGGAPTTNVSPCSVHAGLMTLESTSIYWTSSSNSGGMLQCAGWVDAL